MTAVLPDHHDDDDIDHDGDDFIDDGDDDDWDGVCIECYQGIV